MCPVSPENLLSHYETLRRKESEQLAKLLDTLGKIDGLPDNQVEQARDALFHADHPYLVVLIGPFNSGKSSLINALIGEAALEVGAIPTTSQIAILRHGPAFQRMSAGNIDTIFHPSPLLERVSLVDTPGLESVFKGHDEITQHFLHRADLVLLVMLATQAMSASNISYLQSLRAYGKRVIVVINQIDLLEPGEQETVKSFVAEQARINLGLQPEIWLVSSRLALEAQKITPHDPKLWAESGFEQIEAYMNQALSDATRIRQKLETPLQIVRNVAAVAAARVREQQDAFGEYRRAAQNVRNQIDAAIREQEITLRETKEQVEQAFSEAMRRGRESIEEVFQWSKAFSLAFGGLGELVGLGRLFRRFGAQTPARNAFEAHKVDEPLAAIPTIVDRLGPRLEGRDVKDVDDLIAYTRREMERLPGAVQTKIIGKLQPPATYDRAIMKNVRKNLNMTLEKAGTREFKTIDRAVRNTIAGLGVYELVVVIAFFLSAVMLVATQAQAGTVLLALLVLIGLVMGGLFLMPWRGMLLQIAHARRIAAIRAEYLDLLSKAAMEQIGYGRQMRQDAVAPFIRMVEAQVSQVDQVKAELAAHETALTALEAELGKLRD